MTEPKSTLSIELRDDESADSAVFNYIIDRGLLSAFLKHYFGVGEWHDESVRLQTLANNITPLIPPDEMLTVRSDGMYMVQKTPRDGL